MTQPPALSRDGRCVEVVLVEAPDGRWTRMCIDVEHPVGTDHHCRFRGQTYPFTHGLTRVHVAATDDDQPVLV